MANRTGSVRAIVAACDGGAAPGRGRTSFKDQPSAVRAPGRTAPSPSLNALLALTLVAAAQGQTPVDTCAPAPLVTAFPLILNSQSTSGATDDYDLSASGTCSGGGAQVAGTGAGPDVVLHFITAKTCSLSINLFPFGGVDLALYAVRNCASLASTCLRVSDAAAAGGGEVLNVTVAPLVDYWVIIDGSSGSSGGFGFNIAENPPGQACLGLFVDGFERGGTGNWSATVP